MLRTLVLLLVLANLAFFAWTQGWIDGFAGLAATAQREPERLAQQVRPEAVRILPALGGRASSAAPPLPAPPPASAPSSASEADPARVASAASATAIALTTPVCLEAGPFIGAEAGAAEAAVRSVLPEGGWSSVKGARPGLWMVYLGKFKDRDELLKRQEEVRARRIEYEELRSPTELVPGLSLGRFEARGNAVNAMEKFSLQGIRGGKVIEVRPPAATVSIRVESAAPEVAEKLTALDTPALGKGFVPCARPANN
jgi:hypothetical protein